MKKFIPFKDTSAPTVIIPVTGPSSRSLAFFGNRRDRVKQGDAYNPHHPGYISSTASGSYTAEIDAFRQGVSILNEQQRAQRILPVIDGGTDDYSVVQLNFGQPSMIDPATPFVDKANFQSLSASSGLLALIEGRITTESISSPKSDMPLLQVGKGYNVVDQLNGAIQVFPVRFKAFSQKIFSRSLSPMGVDVRPGIRASLCGGNEHFEQGTTQIESIIPIATQGGSPFIDSGFYMKDTFVVSASLGVGEVVNGAATNFEFTSSIFISDDKHFNAQSLRRRDSFPFVPFNEEKFRSEQYLSEDLSLADPDLKSTVINNLTGSTDRFIPAGFKSATTGFIFTNKGLNVDSIAFGGMNRDA